eukprot:6084848-Prymnesium_polylepis.1
MLGALRQVVASVLICHVPHELAVDICPEDTPFARPADGQMPPTSECIHVETGICHPWHRIEEIDVPLAPCSPPMRPKVIGAPWSKDAKNIREEGSRRHPE